MPVAVPLAVTLAAFAALIACYGMQQGYRYSLEPLLLWLAETLDRAAVNVGFKTIHLFGPLSNAIRYLVRKIDEGLGLAVLAFEWPVGWFWHQLTLVIDFTGGEIAALAETVEAELDVLRKRTIPNSIRGALVGTAAGLAALRAAIAHVSGVVIPGIRSSLDDALEQARRAGRDIAGQAKRIRSLERVTVGAGAAALVGLALARLGLKWLSCRNVTRAAKRICGMDYDVLDALLVGTLFVSGSLSLERITRDLLDETDELATALRYGFRELRHLGE